MSIGFIHSEKVPRVYKAAAKIVQDVAENGASLKQLIYGKKHLNIATTYALAVTTLKRACALDHLLRMSKLLLKEKRLDPWLARVLIYELLWGKKAFKSTCKPIQTILSYEKELRELAKNLDAPTIAEDKQVEKPRYVRVNTLVWSVEEAILSFTDEEWLLLPKSPDYSSFLVELSKLNGSSFIQDFHIPELLAFPSGTQFHGDERYKTGAIILQDKASCFPAFLLKPEPGSVALDMCAAPGMKTTHLAAIMQNMGTVFAVERDARRYKTLCELVGASHASCVTTLHADSMTIDGNKCPNVEYILVDPSCSGSGMSNRLSFESNDSKCSPGRLKSLQSFQVLLLRHALFGFPTVKRVVYSTCSIYPEENEMVVDEILNDMGESYKLRSTKTLLNGNWKNFSSKDYACKKKCLYAKPEDDYSNGFFVAVFDRNLDVPLPELSRVKKGSAKPENNESTEKDKKSEETKKKKKRKTTEMESERVETPSAINDDGGLIEKKRKKKMKAFEPEVSGVDQTTGAPENLTIDAQSVTKKRKKKKKRSNQDVSVETIDN